MASELNLVSKLNPDELQELEFSLSAISPDDGKYRKASKNLIDYLSAGAEWRACALVQEKLLETRVEFGQAKQENLDEFRRVKVSPANMHLLEGEITRHDQLAVIEEIGRHVSPETKALLHPGTTSYDILDTARSYLLKRAWIDVFRPEVGKTIENLCDLGERSLGIIQVGRTHLQSTAPLSFGSTFASYAARLANRVEFSDRVVGDLRGKVSGIVGTGASVEMVIGEGEALKFEYEVLSKLGLEPDPTATQIVQKERLADVGHGIVTLSAVLGDFANDMRLLYSTGIGEVTSRDNEKRLGGSSADATKNNPINYENIAGKSVVVESGMRVVYDLIRSDLQRDLRGSVTARYQPQAMITQTYESFTRVNRSLKNLSINEDVVDRNLDYFRNNPGEAMVAILRGEQWVHPEYGVGHNFVKEMGKKAKQEGKFLLEVSLRDKNFRELYDNKLSNKKRMILQGDVGEYIGHSMGRAEMNIGYARDVVSS